MAAEKDNCLLSKNSCMHARALVLVLVPSSPRVQQLYGHSGLRLFCQLLLHLLLLKRNGLERLGGVIKLLLGVLKPWEGQRERRSKNQEATSFARACISCASRASILKISN